MKTKVPKRLTPEIHKPSPDDSEQFKRFIETARALDCDEDEAAFDEKLKRIATAKPMPKSKRQPKPK
jgi:hypothetical protein